ncbi:MAG: HlyD family efflux transporter periplasmic adaptor subunit [Selenomonadaceae bacterium]|nr:HlyD family efflux transporter periplasmic adaptor subunit [Selenomonadaceae bacterium]
MEVDLTREAKKFFTIGLIGMAVATIIVAGGAYSLHSSNVAMQIYGAEVAGSMVGVRAMSSGKIETLPIESGAKVESGNVIATISVQVSPEEIQQLEETVRLAEQNLTQVQSGHSVRVPVTRTVSRYYGGSSASEYEIADAEAALASASEKLERFRGLAEIGAIPRNQLSSAEYEYNVALDNLNSLRNQYVPPSTQYDTETSYELRWEEYPPDVIESAEISLRQAQAALASAKQESQATEILAPIDGNFYPVDIQVGSNVRAGQVIARIGDTSDLWIEAKVSEDQLKKIQLGQLVSYELNGKNLEGTIIEILTEEDEDEFDEDFEEDDETFDERFVETQSPWIPPDENYGKWIPPDQEEKNSAKSSEQILQNPNPQPESKPEIQSEGQPQFPQSPWQPPDENYGKWQPPTDSKSDSKTDSKIENQATDSPLIDDEEEDDEEWTDSPRIRVSIPQNLDFDCRPGMKSVITIQMS